MKRKINYFEITMKGDGDVKICLEATIDRIIHNNKIKSDKRRRLTSTGLPMLITNCEEKYGKYYYCCLSLVRDDFPEIIDEKEDTTEEIDAEYDPSKGIYEETHFVISKNSDKLLFAVESNMRGPKQRDIEKFFNQTLINLEYKDEFLFDPIFAFDYDSFLERIDEVAQIKMMFHRDEIAGYSDYDESTAVLVKNAIKYADTEFVTLEFKINFQKKAKRHSTQGLYDRVKYFINILKNNPEAKSYIRKLDIRAQDKKYYGNLRLFDLIESKVASEVPAEKKRPTSQYYDSRSLYDAIKEQIEKDFRVK